MMLSRYQKAGNRLGGWSLVEVLMVISVMMILLTVVFLSGHAVVQRANMIKCASNLRQIGVALNLYANDHDGGYPKPYDSTLDPPHQVTWMTAIETYLDYPEGSMGSPPLPRMVGVFICPELTKENINSRQAGYFYNSILMGGGASRPDLRRDRASNDTFLVVEGEPKNGEGQARTTFASSPPNRHHKGAANFLYVDGRVEALSPPFDAADPRWTLEGR